MHELIRPDNIALARQYVDDTYRFSGLTEYKKFMLNNIYQWIIQETRPIHPVISWLGL